MIGRGSHWSFNVRKSLLNLGAIVAVVAAVASVGLKNVEGHASHELLNTSYDPTRELYKRINPAFASHYQKQTGQTVSVRQSHGGSSYQSRQVVQGEQVADIVTLGLPSDIEAIEKRGLIAKDWRQRLPNDAQPYHSTIVFVVRQGNPLDIKDWPDLLRPNVEVILPDPKTSGNGKLALLAAWGSVISSGGTEDDAKAYLKSLLDRAPFLLPAARAAGVAFAVEKKGDVHLAWENEALREVAESKGAVQIVYPSVSILADPSVAWVDANVEKHGSKALAKAYLEYLFSDEAQEIIAEEGYRPFKEAVLARHAARLPKLDLFPITRIAASWSEAQQKFFAENGILDNIYTPKPRT